MLRVANTANDALTIAGLLSPVPFVGAAAVVVDKIVKTCNEVKVHKVRFSSDLVITKRNSYP